MKLNRLLMLVAVYVGFLHIGKYLQSIGMADQDKSIIVGMSLALMYGVGEATKP